MTEFSTVYQNISKPSPMCCASLSSCFGCTSPESIVSPDIEYIENFFYKHASIKIPLIHKEIFGWRTRAKLAVRGNVNSPEIGLFKPGTHQVASTPNCPLHHPSINRVYRIIVDEMIKMKVHPYQENEEGKGASTGLLRTIQLVVERRTRRVQLTLVLNCSQTDPIIEKWVKQLYIQGKFHSIWLNFQPIMTNTIFGKNWRLCEGDAYIEEKIADVTFYFHPACFIQAHLSLFEDMIRFIQRHILVDRNVIDLYSGVGVIGLNVLEKSRQLTCIESNPFAAECFHLSRLKLNSCSQKKVFFHTGNVEAFQGLILNADVVIIDPPRKGVDEQVLEAILSSGRIKQVIYISCNPLSFFRDCLKLLEGGWEIKQAESYLLFPGSNHVEIVCVLYRNNL